jgi:phosphatidylglycerophosphate synthase
LKTLGYIPVLLIALRALLGPITLLAVCWNVSAGVLVAMLLLGFISDVFDGVIARKLNIATAALRRADSLVDTIFFVCMIVAAWISHPSALNPWWLAIAAIAGLEVLRTILDVWKFGREAAYHMWSAKLWGVSLVLALGEIFLTGQAHVILPIAIIIGIFTECEGLLASLLLSEWHHDVPTILHAWKIRINQI